MKLKCTYGGMWYIAVQPEGEYKEWLFRLYKRWQTLTPSEPPIGTRNHRKLRRWWKEHQPPYEACRRLQGLQPTRY